MLITRSTRVQIQRQIPLHCHRCHIQPRPVRGDDGVWVCPLLRLCDAKIHPLPVNAWKVQSNLLCVDNLDTTTQGLLRELSTYGRLKMQCFCVARLKTGLVCVASAWVTLGARCRRTREAQGVHTRGKGESVKLALLVFPYFYTARPKLPRLSHAG